MLALHLYVAALHIYFWVIQLYAAVLHLYFCRFYCVASGVSQDCATVAAG